MIWKDGGLLRRGSTFLKTLREYKSAKIQITAWRRNIDYTGLLVAKDIRPRYDVIRGTEALIIGRRRANSIEFRSYAIQLYIHICRWQGTRIQGNEERAKVSQTMIIRGNRQS